MTIESYHSTKATAKRQKNTHTQTTTKNEDDDEEGKEPGDQIMQRA